MAETRRKPSDQPLPALRVERVEPALSPSRIGGRLRAEGYDVRPLHGTSYLDLDCGAGANLIAQAAAFPEADFTGTPSGGADSIRTFALQAKVQNVETRSADLRNFDADLGRYDFIVANDLFSGAGTAERMALLVLAKRHLAETGALCVGIDVYPGWRILEELRDIFGASLDRSVPLRKQVRAVRAAVWDLTDGIRDGKYPDRKHQLPELQRLGRASDAELFRDLVDPGRRPVSIADFAAMADAAKLKLVGDADLLKTNPVLLPEKLRPKTGGSGPPDLAKLCADIDRYANTRRRMVLLCHAERPAPEIGFQERLEHICLTSTLAQADPSIRETELLKKGKIAFNGPVSYQTSDPVEIVALTLMARHRHFPIQLAQLAAHVDAALRGNAATRIDRDKIAQALFRLCGKLLPTGALIPHMAETRAARRPGNRPRLAPLALLQARQGADRLASLTPHDVMVDDVARFILSRFDGTQAVAQIVADLVQAVADGKFVLPPIAPTPDARANATVGRVLAHAAASGLLVG